MPISPSRDLGLQAPTAAQMDAVLKDAYGTLAPSSGSNGAIGPRLDHKLAYAMQNTEVQIRFFHKNQEPPLQTYYCRTIRASSISTRSAGRTRSR